MLALVILQSAARATAGMVYALDIDGDMLDVIKPKAEKEKMKIS